METTVLVVDDETWICTLLADYLQEEGYRVEVAEDLATARVKLNASRLPNIVILDVMLPDGNGIQFVNELRRTARTNALPVILISAHATQVKDRIDGFQLGADDYLVKPFDLRELKVRMESLMRRVKRNTEDSTSVYPENIGALRPQSTPIPTGVEKALKDIIAREKQVKTSAPQQIVIPEKKTVEISHQKEPQRIVPKDPLKPKVITPWGKRLLQLLFQPGDFFKSFNGKRDLNLWLAMILSFGFGMGIQFGGQDHSWTMGFVGFIAFSVLSLSIAASIAWVIQWAMGLKQKIIKFYDLLGIVGAAFLPLGISSLLGGLYVLVMGGRVGHFTAGLPLHFD